jgi:hypothetical protein
MGTRSVACCVEGSLGFAAMVAKRRALWRSRARVEVSAHRASDGLQDCAQTAAHLVAVSVKIVVQHFI